MKIKKLFIGGYHEIKRPINVVDNSLIRRMDEVGRRLRSEGKDLTPVIGPRHKPARPAPTGIMPMLRNAEHSTGMQTEWPIEAANEPHTSSYGDRCVSTSS
jgi:hypothetical protein